MPGDSSAGRDSMLGDSLHNTKRADGTLRPRHIQWRKGRGTWRIHFAVVRHLFLLYMLPLASCLAEDRSGRRHPEDAPSMVCRFKVPLCVEGRPTVFETLLGPEGFAEGVTYAINVTVLANNDEIVWQNEIFHKPVTAGKLHAFVRTTIPPMYASSVAELELLDSSKGGYLILRVSVIDKYPGLSDVHALICQFQLPLLVETVSERRSSDLKNWRAQRVRLDMYENAVKKALANVPGWRDDRVEKVIIKDVTQKPDLWIRANGGTRDVIKTYKVMAVTTAGEEGPSVAFKVGSLNTCDRPYCDRRDSVLARILAEQGLTPRVLATGVIFDDGSSEASNDGRSWSFVSIGIGKLPLETYTITEWKGTGTFRPDVGDYPAAVFRALGNLIATVHSIESAWFDEFRVEADLPREVHIYSVRCPGFVPAHPAAKRLVTAHGDFSPSNILMGITDPGEGVGGMQVIDLESAEETYAIHDLSMMLPYCGRHKREFLAGYLMHWLPTNGSHKGKQTTAPLPDHVEILLNDTEMASKPGCRQETYFSF